MAGLVCKCVLLLLTLESSCRVCLLVCVSFLLCALSLMFVTIGLFVVSRWWFYSLRLLVVMICTLELQWVDCSCFDLLVLA